MRRGGDGAENETACITCGGGLRGRKLCRIIAGVYAWKKTTKQHFREVLCRTAFPISPMSGRGRWLSAPCRERLAAGEDYAHRHNLFWRFVFEAYGEPFDPKAPPAYGIKTGLLLAHGVGLWDAAESCAREGSLDSDIRDAMPNDFAALFALYPEIERLLFNGQAAFQQGAAGGADVGSAAVYEPGERVYPAGAQAREMARGAARSGNGCAAGNDAGRGAAERVRRCGMGSLAGRCKKAEKSDKILEKIMQQCQVGQQVQSRVTQRVQRWAGAG